MAGTITRETKREGQRKVKRQRACKNQKKRKELVPLMVRNYHACKSWDLIIMGGLKQTSLTNVKHAKKTILTGYHMYKPSTYLRGYLFFYLSTYKWDLLPTELVPKVKPNINKSVEVHPQLSNNGHPVDGVLMGAGSLWQQESWVTWFPSPNQNMVRHTGSPLTR
jgi:hypothetical protein